MKRQHRTPRFERRCHQREANYASAHRAIPLQQWRKIVPASRIRELMKLRYSGL
jgi:hypothetical protein